MNEVQGVHPSIEDLSAFSLGKLDAPAEEAIACHLATCSTCCKALDTVRDDAFVGRLRASIEPETIPGLPGQGSGRFADGATPTDACRTSEVGELPPELARHPRYRILKPLGAGGMGTVYKAEHQLMERLVALKVIRPELTRDPGAVERFRREVKGAARLVHPNIVHAYDAEQAGDAHFLVMEFVEGTSLDRVVAEEGPLPVARACEYIRQVALGLQHAHEQGMVHRDIKPHNLMLTPEGTIKILDFGLARFARESAPPVAVVPGPAAAVPGSLTQTGALMGTPDYMAPEQAVNAHEADIRADVYSLGGTLYFLLVGRPPFSDAQGLDKIMAHIERMPEPPAKFRGDIPAGLPTVLERMLAKDPARRYQTPVEVAHALEPFTRPAVAPLEEPVPEQQAPPQPPRRGRWLRRLAGGLGGAACLAGLVLLAQSDHETAHERLGMIYNVCAVLGGTLLLCQFLLSLLGLGHHHDIGGGEVSHDVDHGHDMGGHHGESHDADHDAQSSWFVGLLTFRTIVAALVFFGLAGKAAAAASLDPGTTLFVALAAGTGALFLVAWMMKALYRLRDEGTVRIDRAVGRTGTVYLTIPANKSGLGKVHLNVQNRTVEYQAVTAHQALPTGTPVVVQAVINSDTVEVTIATSSENNHA
jgi:hypothetical protein